MNNQVAYGFQPSLNTFFSELNAFQKNIINDKAIDFSKWKTFQEIFLKLTHAFDNYNFSKEENAIAIQEFKSRFKPYTDQSVFATRTLTWPKGYPGDHITLEQIYAGYPRSEAVIGQYIDLYYMSRDLAVGVRERKDYLKKHLEQELFNKKPQRVLNIGCGSTRELYDIGLRLNEYKGSITCLDFDEDALAFSERTMASRSMDISKFTFRKMNVLKLVNSQFMNQELGAFDLIYSAGLFDYIQDKGLKRIFNSLYENLNEGGKIIAPFKDCNYYTIFDYHWLGNWDAFYQRTKSEVLDLLQSSIPAAKIEIVASSTKAINFYMITK